MDGHREDSLGNSPGYRGKKSDDWEWVVEISSWSGGLKVVSYG